MFVHSRQAHEQEAGPRRIERIANAAAYVNSARTVLFLAKAADGDLRILESLKHNESFKLKRRLALTDVEEDASPRNPTAYVRVTLTECHGDEDVDSLLQKKPLSEIRKDILAYFATHAGDHSYKEVAKALGRHEGTIKARLNDMANDGQIARGTIVGTFGRV
jgi:Winged helix-turn-helix DNA-binding